MSDAITIVIADDHPLLRKGLADLLRADASLRIVAEAADGEAALAAIVSHRPRIAILDLEMPKLSGLDVAKRVRDNSLPTAVVILTMHTEREFLDRALDVGVAGYLAKENAAGDIIACINLVAAGRSYVSASLSQHLLNRRDDKRAVGGIPGLADLTPTERNVLQLIAASRSTKQIAAELGIGGKTVENHRHRICAKLGLFGTNALLVFALENKSTLERGPRTS